LDENPDKDSKFYQSRGLTLGLNMAAGMGVFTFIGHKIDQKFNTQFWTLVGMFFGLFYCGYEVWKLIQKK